MLYFNCMLYWKNINYILTVLFYSSVSFTEKQYQVHNQWSGKIDFYRFFYICIFKIHFIWMVELEGCVGGRWRRWTEKTNMLPSFGHSPEGCKGRGWARFKAGDRISSVYPMWVRGPRTWVVLHCIHRHISR